MPFFMPPGMAVAERNFAFPAARFARFADEAAQYEKVFELFIAGSSLRQRE
jgi:hypothetical protein